MDILLIRHADAVALGEDGISDDKDRPLTARGEEQARTLAENLRAHGVEVEVLLSSPLVRAWQSAEVLAGGWSTPSPELRRCDELEPGTKRRKLVRQLSDLGLDRVALVGHEPDLSRLAAWLLGSRKVQIRMAKAGVACIRCEGGLDKGSGTLMWLVPPTWQTSRQVAVATT